MGSRPGPVAALVTAFATALVVVVLVLQVALVVLRPEDGVLGLLQVLAWHAGAVALFAAPFVWLGTRRRAVILTVALAAVLGYRFGGEWLSLPSAQDPSASRLTVTTWNLEIASRAAQDTAAALRGVDADVVLLQELTSKTAAAIDEDPDIARAFPHRDLNPRRDSAGMGVLSRFPITARRFDTGPVVQVVTLDAPFGPVVVVNAHPFRPDGVGGAGYDPAVRNEHLRNIRQRVDELVAAGHRVILAGDFNTAPTEPAFEWLTAGLADAHAEAGMGPGATWRPHRLAFLGFGLLRIDLVLAGPGLRPVATTITCPDVGDHCRLTAWLEVASD